MLKENRIGWTDRDWANHFNCTLQNVHQYRKVLKQNFLPCIEIDKENREFYFVLYKIGSTLSGKQKLVPMISGGMAFDSHKDAIKDAYTNIMPGITLEKNWAAGHHIPVNAIQMMHVRMK
jgi:hypothetical protein